LVCFEGWSPHICDVPLPIAEAGPIHELITDETAKAKPGKALGESSRPKARFVALFFNKKYVACFQQTIRFVHTLCSDCATVELGTFD
jgi:hypothetical protein